MFKVYNDIKEKEVWRFWVILLFELIGTFLLVFEIISPSTLNLDSKLWYQMIFGTYIMKAFWVAGFTLILIYIYKFVSVNLNPVITLSEIAIGHNTWIRGIFMIVVQIIGALCAAEFAHFLAVQIGTWEPGNSTLDAVYPRFIISSTGQNWFGLDSTYIDFLNGGGTWISASSKTMKWSEWLFILVPYLIEFLFTFGLIASIIYSKKITQIYGKKINDYWRPILVFGALMVFITFGLHTNNISLNPVRLYAPAIVSQFHGGAKTLQFTWIFLFGEMSAVLLVFFIEGKRNEKDNNLSLILQKELRFASTEAIVIKTKYDWVLNGNKQLEKMTKKELLKTAEKIKALHSPKGTRDEIEYDIIEFLIFGNEEENNIIKKESVKNKSTMSNTKENSS
ncbi:MAG: aquaporin [Mycoplasmataceae bacterium]|nr:aquaporin [Mycoplasmataceae bacterium]